MSLSRKRRTIHVPIKQKLASFGESLAKWKRAGLSITTTEEHDIRLKVCQRCVFHKKLPVGGICLKCGCFSIKLWMLSEKCPINKW